MQQPGDGVKYDVIIVGAGIAGCACALALKDSGLKVALLDKQSFPRDKVCGDAIPGRAIKTLKNIDPAFEAAFKAFPLKLETKKTSLYYKEQVITFDWVREAYTCARLDFDNFLFSLVKEQTGTDILIPFAPGSINVHPDSISLSIKNDNSVLEAKILIGADGAHSMAAKSLAPKNLNRKHHVGSVRAYFSNVAGGNDHITEIYFDKLFLPSYLWVFPLPGNKVNVGFGMLSSEIAKRKINIKKAFYEFIDQTPALKSKFRNATQIGALEGFGLPLGSDVGTLSGNRFMLAGDAASLIDPVSGDGIGNAMLSGRLAAEQAILCLQQNDFSGEFMMQYDRALLNAIGKELKTHYKAQRILSAAPFLLDLVFPAAKNKLIKSMIQKAL